MFQFILLFLLTGIMSYTSKIVFGIFLNLIWRNYE